jgi:CubicO group peptidase (beta-lactamase class C family)
MTGARILMTAVVSVIAVCEARCSADDATSLPQRQAEAVDAAISSQMESQKLVGVAVGIIRNGRIAYTKGFGLADREQQTPATADTVFNWASNSKPLAAVLAMQLVEQGKLDLDADVRTYVPEFPDKGMLVTSRHLLAHLSGIPHYANGLVLPAPDGRLPLAKIDGPVPALTWFSASPLLFAPGEKTSYSSYAYVLLSAVIERAGGELFDRQMQSRIAKPLKLESLQLDVTANGQPHWATGYVKRADDSVVPAAEEAHFWKYGAGGYKSNVRDFARWAQALINHELVKQPAEQQMWMAQKLASGEPGEYGLGFVVEQQNGLKVSHNGAQKEVRTRMVLYPQAKSGVVVMSNCDFADAGKLSTAVFSALDAR